MVAPLVVTQIPDLPNSKNAYFYDAHAYWYAWGRMDAGDPPVIIFPTNSKTKPDVTATVWYFGRIWASLMTEFDDPNHPRISTPGIPAAWDTFVKSGGRKLD